MALINVLIENKRKKQQGNVQREGGPMMNSFCVFRLS